MNTEKINSYDKAASKVVSNSYTTYSWHMAIAVAVICLLFETLPALLIDPYKVFGVSQFNQRNFPPNTRYSKVEHLLKNQEHDAFIIGSSRSNFYRIESASQLSSHHYYNMNAVGDNALGARRKVEWLINHENVKQIILAVDYDLGYRKIDPLTLSMQDHPQVSGEFSPLFYGKYFLFQPNTLMKCIELNSKDELIYASDDESGHFWNRNYVRMRENPRRYVGNTFSKLYSWEKPEPIVKDVNSLEEYRKAAELAKENDVELIFVVNPYNQHLYASFDREDYADWLRELVEIQGQVWDFSGFNSITTNDRNYYDTSHFVEEIGDLVLNKVFGSPSAAPDIPDDFGVRLTPDNIEARLQHLSDERDRYQPQLSQADVPK